MGWAVGRLGDVNGDGFDDVVMTDYRFDSPEFDEGRVLVYGGSPTGLTSDPIWAADGNQAEALFADAVTSAGDVNGDGRPDMLLGTQFWDVENIDEGVASVYLATCGAEDADGDGVAVSGAGRVLPHRHRGLRRQRSGPLEPAGSRGRSHRQPGDGRRGHAGMAPPPRPRAGPMP